MTKKILIGYQKGGVGKTYIAVNVAYYLQTISKGKTLLVDGDFGQSTSSSWIENRKSNNNIKTYQTIDTVKYNIYFGFDKSKYEYEIFDVTGNLDSLLDIIKKNDINTIILPLTPNGADFEPFSKFLQQLKGYDEGLEKRIKLIIIFNKVEAKNLEMLIGTKLNARDLVEATKLEHIDVIFLDSLVVYSAAIPKEFNDGMSAIEYRQSKKSHKDIALLMKELARAGAF